MNSDYSASSEYVFRGIEYMITLRTIKNGTVLSVEVEDKITSDQWRGAFDSSYIEDLTHKTGNFKQFDVFVSMLESALDKSSESVTLDLLTFSDLELLRNRKAVNSSKGHSRPRVSASRQQENKRYLILVYSVEFDRIHYPLPLPYQGKPDPVHLQTLVRKLNDEITKLKSGRNAKLQDEQFLRLKEDYECLLQEKVALETAIETFKENQTGSKLAVSKEVKIMKKVVQNLELEMMKEKNRFQRQISKKNSEVKKLSAELHEVSARERTLQIRVKSLTNELAMYKRSRTPLPHDHSTASGRTSRNVYSGSRGSTARPRSGARPLSSAPQRSSSRGSRSGSFSRPSRSGSRDRPVSTRERSSSRESRRPYLRDGHNSRTPTPNRFPRFNPTLYIEEKNRKLQQSKERLNRRNSASYVPTSTESRGRTRLRYGSRDVSSSSRDRLSGGGLRRRNASLESRNSSDNGSITRMKTRKPKAWEDSPVYSALDDEDRRLSSTPDIKRAKAPRRKKRQDAGMDEIDARLNALQDYMREIERKK